MQFKEKTREKMNEKTVFFMPFHQNEQAYYQFNKRNYGVTVDHEFLANLAYNEYLNTNHMVFFSQVFAKTFLKRKIIIADCYFFSEFMPDLTDQLQLQQNLKTEKKPSNLNNFQQKNISFDNSNLFAATNNLTQQNQTKIYQGNPQSDIIYQQKMEQKTTNQSQIPQVQSSQIAGQDNLKDKISQEQNFAQNQELVSAVNPLNAEQNKSTVTQDNNTLNSLQELNSTQYTTCSQSVNQTGLLQNNIITNQPKQQSQIIISQSQTQNRSAQSEIQKKKSLQPVQNNKKNNQQTKQQEFVQEKEQEKLRLKAQESQKMAEIVIQNQILQQQQIQQQQEQLKTAQQIKEDNAKKYNVKITNFQVTKVEKSKYQLYRLPNLLNTLCRINQLEQNGKPFDQCDFSYFPINLQNSHWVCIIYFREFQVIQYLDPLQGLPKDIISGITQILQAGQEQRHEYQVMGNSPIQKNNYDCGVFCLMALLTVFRQGIPIKPKSYSQQEITFFRQTLQHLAIVGSQMDLTEEDVEYIVGGGLI